MVGFLRIIAYEVKPRASLWSDKNRLALRATGGFLTLFEEGRTEGGATALLGEPQRVRTDGHSHHLVRAANDVFCTARPSTCVNLPFDSTPVRLIKREIPLRYLLS